MEETGNRGGGGGGGGLLGFAVRQSSARSPGSSKHPFRSPSKNTPSFRRLSSNKPSRRDSRSFQWIRNNVVFWLVLISLWAYIGFHFQSKWAHSDHNKAEFVGYKSAPGSVETVLHSPQTNTTRSVVSDAESGDVNLVRKGRQVSSRQNAPRKKGRRQEPKLRGVAKPKAGVAAENRTGEVDEGMIPRKNTSYGMIMGPFGKTEDSVLGWSAEKRMGTCDRRSEFARIVWSRSFVLIFHELSMTGAPLSMMELASEILSCGGRVSAVVLSRKGGLMVELDRRGIKVLKDKANFSYKTAMKADLVIAGSTVCSSWVEQFLLHNPSGSSQIVWWIMENRREYFDRSKHLLNRVKMLIFLSDSQSKQWSTWCQEEHIQLNSEPMLVPLSVNDELAFVAGIPCSLNTAVFSVEKMLEKRDMLRSAVRKEMGLDDNDMVVMSLSSINPGKGQRLLLQSALLVAEHNVSLKDPKSYGVVEEKELSGVPQNQTIMDAELNTGVLLQKTNRSDKLADEAHKSNGTSVASKKKKRRKHSRLSNILSLGNHAKSLTQKQRNLLSERESRQEQTLKVLIGSIGSKSNKVLYIKAMLRFISQHSNLSKSILWTPTTTRVASLYAAADVYVINAQGLGETFGRVTIEAMAFGLPILGTDAGGTGEIVQHRITGLLHPVGREGIATLAEHIQYLLSDQSTRKKMGMRGRLKVQNMYLKHHMYKRFTAVLVKCMKPK